MSHYFLLLSNGYLSWWTLPSLSFMNLTERMSPSLPVCLSSLLFRSFSRENKWERGTPHESQAQLNSQQNSWDFLSHSSKQKQTIQDSGHTREYAKCLKRRGSGPKTTWRGKKKKSSRNRNNNITVFSGSEKKARDLMITWCERAGKRAGKRLAGRWKKRKEGKKRPSQRLTLFPFTPSSSSSSFGRKAGISQVFRSLCLEKTSPLANRHPFPLRSFSFRYRKVM